MVNDIDYKRLVWHSRRGMLELDVLLVSFVKEIYPSLPQADQLRYRQLIECEDNDLAAWFLQRSRPEDPDLARIVDLILQRVQPA